jgi:hypothetical protein
MPQPIYNATTNDGARIFLRRKIILGEGRKNSSDQRFWRDAGEDDNERQDD